MLSEVECIFMSHTITGSDSMTSEGKLFQINSKCGGGFIIITKTLFLFFNLLVARLLISHLQPYPPYFSIYSDNVLKFVHIHQQNYVSCGVQVDLKYINCYIKVV
jgi:hypothetical protein